MKTVLLVDDEPCILETGRYILEVQGYHVLTACDGEEALAVLRQEKPLVVLLDIMMPNLNGFEVCREIRQDPELEKTYVIFLTARGQKSDEEMALEAGGDSYLTKPINEEEISERIAECFSMPDAPHPIFRAIPVLQEKGHSKLRHDLMGLLFAVNGTAKALLDEGPLDEWQTQCVKTIMGAGKQIEQLVRDQLNT